MRMHVRVRRPSLGANYRRLFGASTISNLGDGVAVIAYPWLASTVTRNPLLIALIAVAQRLPWLVFTLPAGVITDRYDRKMLMVSANACRAILTAMVALVVLWRREGLPGPERLDAVIGTEWFLYLSVLAATVLLGIGEVFYDNCAQTLMPSIVDDSRLEQANGRLWAAERTANMFLGPPLGSVLIAAGVAVPFFFDAGSFAVSAALMTTITVTSRSSAVVERKPWRREMAEGVRWLWSHDLLRPMALVLGALNAIVAMTFAVFVLFAQDVLGTSTTEFAALTMAAAVGGVVGGWSAAKVRDRIGSGPSLGLSLAGGGLSFSVIGLASSVPVVAVMFALNTYLAVLWSVITVSLRQSIIPDHLLGRVNSVYRFFAWGMLPVGSLIGGLVVAVVGSVANREVALRAPWFVGAGGQTLLFAYAARQLTTARMEKARQTATVGRAPT